jgi:hypothetical protein
LENDFFLYIDFQYIIVLNARCPKSSLLLVTMT